MCLMKMMMMISVREIRVELTNMLEGREWESDVKALLPELEIENIDIDHKILV